MNYFYAILIIVKSFLVNFIYTVLLLKIFLLILGEHAGGEGSDLTPYKSSRIWPKNGPKLDFFEV